MLFKNKKIFYFLFSIISLFAILIVRYLSSNNCFWGDDFEFSIYSVNEHTFDCLVGWSRLDHGGYYLGSFLCKFFCFKLPLLLGLHPSDFLIHLSILNGIFFVVVSSLVAKFATFHRKSKLLFLTAFIFFLLYSIFQAISCDVIKINYAFYRYCFSLIFYCTFWYFIYKHLLYKYEKKHDAALWAVCLCGFVVGTSIEIAFISSVIFACLIFMYDRIICHYLKTSDNKDFLKSFKFNLDKNFYYPVLYLFIGVLLFTTTQGFISVAQSRGIGNTNIFDLNLFKEFFTAFFNIYVLDIWYYWLILIAIGILSLVFAIKRNEIKKVIFPLFMEISIITVILSLLLCGKTFLIDNERSLFLYHINVIFLFKMLFLIPIFIFTGYVFKNIAYYIKQLKIKNFIKKTLINLPVFILIICLIHAYSFHIQYYINSENQLLNINRKVYYIAEKILRFNYLQNKVPEIPTEVCKIHPYFIDYDFDNTDVLTENKLSYVYYARLYKYEKAKEIGYKYSDDALKKFYDAGGAFSKEELKNIKFSRLSDEDFVLNKQQPKPADELSYKQMQKKLSKYWKVFENRN